MAQVDTDLGGTGSEMSARPTLLSDLDSQARKRFRSKPLLHSLHYLKKSGTLDTRCDAVVMNPRKIYITTRTNLDALAQQIATTPAPARFRSTDTSFCGTLKA